MENNEHGGLRWFNHQQTGFLWDLHGIYMGFTWDLVGLTLQQTNIAMENGLFVDDLPIKHRDFFYTIAMPDS